MAEASTRRRGRGGGGAARRAERTAVRIETAKYIERNIPNLEFLNEEALEIIEANATDEINETHEINETIEATETDKIKEACGTNESRHDSPNFLDVWLGDEPI